MANTLILYDGRQSSAERVANAIGYIIGNVRIAEIGDSPEDVSVYDGFCFIFNFYGALTAGKTKSYLLRKRESLVGKRIAFVGMGFSDAGFTKYVVDMEFALGGDLSITGMFLKDERTTSEIGYQIAKKLRAPVSAMPEEMLVQEIDSFIYQHTTMALSTGGGLRIRCTPLEYLYLGGVFYIISEGGLKFSNILDNSNVSAAIFDEYSDDTKPLRGLQVYGVAEQVERESESYWQILSHKGVTPKVLSGLPVTLFVLRIVPMTYEYLNSSFVNAGYDARQVLDTKYRAERWEAGYASLHASEKQEAEKAEEAVKKEPPRRTAIMAERAVREELGQEIRSVLRESVPKKSAEDWEREYQEMSAFIDEREKPEEAITDKTPEEEAVIKIITETAAEEESIREEPVEAEEAAAGTFQAEKADTEEPAKEENAAGTFQAEEAGAEEPAEEEKNTAGTFQAEEADTEEPAKQEEASGTFRAEEADAEESVKAEEAAAGTFRAEETDAEEPAKEEEAAAGTFQAEEAGAEESAKEEEAVAGTFRIEEVNTEESAAREEDTVDIPAMKGEKVTVASHGGTRTTTGVPLYRSKPTVTDDILSESLAAQNRNLGAEIRKIFSGGGLSFEEQLEKKRAEAEGLTSDEADEDKIVKKGIFDDELGYRRSVPRSDSTVEKVQETAREPEEENEPYTLEDLERDTMLAEQEAEEKSIGDKKETRKGFAGFFKGAAKKDVFEEESFADDFDDLDSDMDSDAYDSEDLFEDENSEDEETYLRKKKQGGFFSTGFGRSLSRFLGINPDEEDDEEDDDEDEEEEDLEEEYDEEEDDYDSPDDSEGAEPGWMARLRERREDEDIDSEDVLFPDVKQDEEAEESSQPDEESGTSNIESEEENAESEEENKDEDVLDMPGIEIDAISEALLRNLEQVEKETSDDEKQNAGENLDRQDAEPESDEDSDREDAEPETDKDSDWEDAEPESDEDSDWEDAEPESDEDSDREDAEPQSDEDSDREDAEPESDVDSDWEDTEPETKEDTDWEDAEPESDEDSDREDAKPETVEDPDEEDTEPDDKTVPGKKEKESIRPRIFGRFFEESDDLDEDEEEVEDDDEDDDEFEEHSFITNFTDMLRSAIESIRHDSSKEPDIPKLNIPGRKDRDKKEVREEKARVDREWDDDPELAEMERFISEHGEADQSNDEDSEIVQSDPAEIIDDEDYENVQSDPVETIDDEYSEIVQSDPDEIWDDEDSDYIIPGSGESADTGIVIRGFDDDDDDLDDAPGMYYYKFERDDIDSLDDGE